MSFNLVLSLGLISIIVILLSWKLSKKNNLSETIELQKSPNSKFINIRKKQIHYIQEGTGPNILLIHGIGASVFTWRLLLPLLTKDYTVTAIDLIGFGNSDKPDNYTYDLDTQSGVLIEFCNELGIKQARVVGSSMGGTLALWLAKLEPQRFFEIVALSPAADPKRAVFNFQKVAFMAKFVNPVVNKSLIKTLLHRVVENKLLINDETIDAYYKPYAQNQASVKAVLKSFSLLRDPRLPFELSKIQTRVLILWGSLDKITPIDWADDVRKALQNNSSFSEHKLAGHHIMEDDPVWTSEQIKMFFGSTKI